MGGAPCQPFSGLNADRKGFDHPRSDGIAMSTRLVKPLKEEIGSYIVWDAMLENVASVSLEHRSTITNRVEE
eukprot:2994048-Karenia_brevis.AAC.1